MQKLWVLWLAMFCLHTTYAQSTLILSIKDSLTKQPMAGASIHIPAINKTFITDSNGLSVIVSVPVGQQTITISFTGYKEVQKQLLFPLSQSDTLLISLQRDEEALGEVIVQSTRTGRSIANTPTRIETIDGEELDEKNNMRPANVSMLLHESTGLQVQQTSATSGNASIRIQGLDGRYTQLLKDGYPNFGNFANGLSILEIPPLDLKQVEIIKGPASTLYGGGAIAGVVNFISKLPAETFEGDIILNQSHVGQTNIGAYLSQKKKHWGYAMLALANFQKLYDVDKDGFAELPRNNNVTFNPRLFYYPNSSVTIMLGNSFTKGRIEGGDVQVIKGNSNAEHVYFENNSTTRNITTLEIDKRFANRSSVRLKQSLSLFDRHIAIPDYRFAGINTNSFTDISYITKTEKHTLIGGLNFIYDDFRQEETDSLTGTSNTWGAYLQDTWDISATVKAEAGVRFDNASYRNINYSRNQLFLLPRLSLLFRWRHNLSSRIGGGLGYKVPTVFTERTESLQYQHLLPLNNVTAERSAGGTADINYTVKFDDITVSINHMFFITSIVKPLVLDTTANGNFYFANASKPIVSKGFETNLKVVYKDLKLFAGYTFTNAKATYTTGNSFLPLLPKSKLNLTLMYEKEDNFKLGLEGYYTGHQYLYNGSRTPSFWEFGFSAQKTFKRFSLFINFENFTDQRQSRYKRVVNPPYNAPTFDDIWNHVEGVVVNGGVKIKW